MDENMKELNVEALDEVAGGKNTDPYGGYAKRPREKAGFIIYQIQSHDNLTRIAARHYTTVAAIMAANRDVLPNANRIRAGYFIYIPA